MIVEINTQRAVMLLSISSLRPVFSTLFSQLTVAYLRKKSVSSFVYPYRRISGIMYLVGVNIQLFYNNDNDSH
jgi:hypothetical protein